MSVESQALNIIKSYHKLLQENFTLRVIEKKQYNFEFVVENGIQKLKVQVYFGKKGVKTVLQGNSDSDIYSRVNAIITGQPDVSNLKREFDEPEQYIGSDETGKGDFFGPLVIASVFVDENVAGKMRKIGVTDSKELSDPKINLIADQIKNITDLFNIVILEPEEYNRIYANYKNLNILMDQAHSAAVKNLLERTSCKNVIVDKFCKTPLSIEKEFNSVKFNYFTKAERYTAVAAASILARAEMNEWFENQPILLPKGASNNVEAEAKKLKKKYGVEFFKKTAKLHFKTINKI